MCAESGGGAEMLKLKSCPRCRGDILFDRDWYGRYKECLQCGYYGDLESTIKALEQRPEKTTGNSPVSAATGDNQCRLYTVSLIV